jgi:hypothetical protein
LLQARNQGLAGDVLTWGLVRGAGIADPIAVGVGLIGVRYVRAVVADVAHTIAVGLILARIRRCDAVVTRIAIPVCIAIGLTGIGRDRAVVFVATQAVLV